MKILPHERPGQRPAYDAVRTIHDMSDAELELMGPWRLSRLPGVNVNRDTIKARLVRQGMSKREACTAPVRKRCKGRVVPVRRGPQPLSYPSMSLISGIPSGTLWHRINRLGMTPEEAMSANYANRKSEVTSAAEEAGLNPRTVYSRMMRGATLEEALRPVMPPDERSRRASESRRRNGNYKGAWG